MNRLTIDVGQVVLETEAERSRLQGATSTIQEAFRLLAQRLDGTPFGRSGETKAFALECLELSAISLDDLLSNRGAERLADELYHQLLRRTSWTKR